MPFSDSSTATKATILVTTLTLIFTVWSNNPRERPRPDGSPKTTTTVPLETTPESNPETAPEPTAGTATTTVPAVVSTFISAEEIATAESAIASAPTATAIFDVPAIDLVHSLIEPTSNSGLTFFGLPPEGNGPNAGPARFVGVNSLAEVVWFYESSETAGRDPIVRSLGNGELLLFNSTGFERVSLSGELLESTALEASTGLHHDAVLLPNNHVLALTRSTQDVAGQMITGDVIIEFDTNGDIIWEWSTFDHLDVTRFPGELSLSTGAAAGSGLDWTHANSVYFDEATNSILLSLRSQSWVVNIDRSTSEINWIAGDSAGIAPTFDETFLQLTSGTWQTAQHAATYTAAGDLLVYDNRNESGGEGNNSRGVIYAIDADAQTATQTFEYIAPVYTSSMGDADELAGGNILLTAGGRGSSPDASIVEANASGETIWEIAVERTTLYRSERVSFGEFLLASDEEANAPATNPSDTAPDASAVATDITGARLTSTNAACSAYVGSYFSNITDHITETEFVGGLDIASNTETCTLTSNQIPNHDIGVGATFANNAAEVTGTFSISANPTVNETPTELGFNAHAVVLNGVIWEAFPAACFGEGPSPAGREAIGCGGNQLGHPWRYNIGSPINDTFRLDDYSAHAQATGVYHYHSTPVALYDTACDGIADSPVIGFARDGFPIYGPCFTDENGTIRSANSSYVLREGEREEVAGFTTPTAVGNVASTQYDGQFIGDYQFSGGSGDLDECNGMTVDGSYGYYITSEYPYVVSCFSGTPSNDFG